MKSTAKTRGDLEEEKRGPVLVAANMRISALLAGVEIRRLVGSPEAEISSLAYHSRRVQLGGVFFALRGEKADGNAFVPAALERGATAIVSEQVPPPGFPGAATWIEAIHARRALAVAAANFYGHPAEALSLVAVTGTNGKTTITHLVDSILRAAGHVTGMLGTIAYRTPRGLRKAPNTTPESLDFQELLAEVRAAGGTAVALEASSHALALDRLWGCQFDAAIFTNLAREHLDYHKTFDDYFAAKRILFESTGAGAPAVGVINTDDLYGQKLVGLARRTLTYGLKNDAELTTRKFDLSFSGLAFTAQTPVGKIQVESSLVGRINVYNILAAIGAGIAQGLSVSAIEEGIRELESVSGRFQRIDEGQPFLVVVDYAHTDDALHSLITTARELNPNGRIITLFGAGGDRDRTKRPLMGEAAGSLSDLVILADDNPRNEDPLRIINDVVVGLQKVNGKYRIEPDREKAIELAIDEAAPGDIVLLAGKGHEDYQAMRDCTLEWDDREMARKALRRRGYSKPPR